MLTLLALGREQCYISLHNQSTESADGVGWLKFYNKRQKRLPLETKNTLRIRKWKSLFYWDSS